MGELEVLMDEERTVKVVRHYDLRRMLSEAFERHRALRWPSCRCSPSSVREETFNDVLWVLFVFTLCFCIINIIFFERVTQRVSSQFEWKGHVPLVMLVALLVVCVYMTTTMKKNDDAGSATPKRAEVPTIASLVRKV